MRCDVFFVFLPSQRKSVLQKRQLHSAITSTSESVTKPNNTWPPVELGQDRCQTSCKDERPGDLWQLRTQHVSANAKQIRLRFTHFSARISCRSGGTVRGETDNLHCYATWCDICKHEVEERVHSLSVWCWNSCSDFVSQVNNN